LLRFVFWLHCGPEVLFETCVAMKVMDDDDDDDAEKVTDEFSRNIDKGLA